MAAVDPGCTDTPVRAFGTFTQDLHDPADWFKACGVTSVAMESTGVYWIPAYEILEKHGFEVILVNARYAKNVPGRKTDVCDAAWLRQLHSHGLLRVSFRPDAEIATLRAYLRQRERLVEYAAAHIQHMPFDVRTALYGVLGVDLTEIHGLGPSLALKLIGECGTDRGHGRASSTSSPGWVSRRVAKSSAAMCSLHAHGDHPAGSSVVALPATTIRRSDTALGAFYRRLSSRAGKAKDVRATARKIAVLFYNALRHGITYRDPGADH
ncbi:transposase [Mesorhizobium sp. M1348]|uniref:IS110 family transposase n=1 Tax=Mesorhizobium sp. M1348 TaxID=2957089 RepID=UPI00333688E3